MQGQHLSASSSGRFRRRPDLCGGQPPGAGGRHVRGDRVRAPRAAGGLHQSGEVRQVDSRADQEEGGSQKIVKTLNRN